MRWLLCGFCFAAFVATAIGTASIRANNALLRFDVERAHARMRDRRIESTRLELELADRATELRLAAELRRRLEDERVRRGSGT